jgi:hypothetical protein
MDRFLRYLTIIVIVVVGGFLILLGVVGHRG